MMFRLAIKSLLSRRFSAAVCVAMIALSTLALLTVDTVYRGTQSAFSRGVQGIDLMVGAPTGDINLLLFSAFHVGAPSRELSFSTFKHWQNNPAVKRAVPLMLGDSHKGFRVIGTNQQLFDHLRATNGNNIFAQGAPFTHVFEVTLGREVARKLGYRLGDQLILSHGMGSHSFQQHDARTFTVTGILAATGTPIDKTLQVSLDGIEAIHWPEQKIANLPTQLPIGENPQLTPKSLAAFYLTLENKVRTFQLQRAINQYPKEPTQAVLPGVAVTQLWGMLDWIEIALLTLGGLASLIATIGVSGTLLTHLEQRMKEFQLLRTLGARQRFIFTLLGIETTSLVALGALIGCVGTIVLERVLLTVAQNRWGLYWALDIDWLFISTGIATLAVIAGIIFSGLSALRLRKLSL
ncbi:ABC transporter permease [Gilvimarinus chinensis]|uniref:ABC transporter permease n=1 Tax=Gilvimarinus chinensis TaxID=396005 RepID=UPI00037A9B7C|nr:FtsX-like permease family protein [Gilvimarinus chinensis]